MTNKNDDGYGNRIENLPIRLTKLIPQFENLILGDTIGIYNKEGCRIATYKITKYA